MAGDANFANVSLLLHGNGANASTSIVDSSTSPKTVTCHGAAQISTAQSKFNGSSISLSSSNSYLTVLSSADFDLGSGDFTIEFFYWPVSRTAYGAIISRDGADYPWTLYHGTGVNSGNPAIQFGSGTGWLSAAQSFGAVSNSAWVHLEVTRASGTFRTFNAGALVTTDSSWGGAIASSSGDLTIGKNGAGDYINGYLAELRITKGVARHTASFAPPAASLPDWLGEISGVIYDDAGAPCSRVVRAYRRDTGALVGSITSDASTGAYTVKTPTSDEVSIIVLDDTAGTLENDLIARVIPA